MCSKAFCRGLISRTLPVEAEWIKLLPTFRTAAPIFPPIWKMAVAVFLIISVKDLQEMLDVSRSTVYKLLRQNEFRWIQLEGGGYRISKKSFDEWLDKGNASVTS